MVRDDAPEGRSAGASHPDDRRPDDLGKEEGLPIAAQTTTPEDPAGPVAVSGMPLGLEELYREHHGRVFRTAYRLTGDAMDAEDVLQTVFVRLLRREDGPEIAAGAAGYFHRAAVNAALDLLRSRRHRGAVDLEEVGERLEDASTPGPERRQGGRELAQGLRGALARLSPKSAEIFALRYLEGHGNKEIAELLGTTQTAIAVTLHRVRARLREELAAYRGGVS